LLASERIEYLLVGGYAVSYHGYPRPTGDLDIWVSAQPENASRLNVALAKFGFGESAADPGLFLAPGRVVRMGVPPVRIELINKISGVDFAACYARRARITWDGTPVNLICFEDLLANKRAAGRAKDANDVMQLEKKSP
jgi:hypothetical protein